MATGSESEGYDYFSKLNLESEARFQKSLNLVGLEDCPYRLSKKIGKTASALMKHYQVCLRSFELLFIFVIILYGGFTVHAHM